MWCNSLSWNSSWFIAIHRCSLLVTLLDSHLVIIIPLRAPHLSLFWYECEINMNRWRYPNRKEHEALTPLLWFFEALKSFYIVICFVGKFVDIQGLPATNNFPPIFTNNWWSCLAGEMFRLYNVFSNLRVQNANDNFSSGNLFINPARLRK